MITVKVWILVMTGWVNGGGLGAIQPFMFPTMDDCQQVATNAVNRGTSWRCIETTVLVPAK